MKIGKFFFTPHALLRFAQRHKYLSIMEEIKDVSVIGGKRKQEIHRRLSKKHKEMDSIMFVSKREAVFVCVPKHKGLTVVTVLRYKPREKHKFEDLVAQELQKNLLVAENELEVVRVVRERARFRKLSENPVYLGLKGELAELAGTMSAQGLVEQRNRLNEYADIVKAECSDIRATFSEADALNRLRSNNRGICEVSIEELGDVGLGYKLDDRFKVLRRAYVTGNFDFVVGVDDSISAKAHMKLLLLRAVQSLFAAPNSYSSLEVSTLSVTLENLEKRLRNDMWVYALSTKVKKWIIAQDRIHVAERLDSIECAWDKFVPVPQSLGFSSLNINKKTLRVPEYEFKEAISYIRCFGKVLERVHFHQELREPQFPALMATKYGQRLMDHIRLALIEFDSSSDMRIPEITTSLGELIGDEKVIFCHHVRKIVLALESGEDISRVVLHDNLRTIRGVKANTKTFDADLERMLSGTQKIFGYLLQHSIREGSEFVNAKALT